MSAPNHDPTPEEIAAVTAALRATWDEREHYLRAGLKVPRRLAIRSDWHRENVDRWEAPAVRVGAGTTSD